MSVIVIIVITISTNASYNLLHFTFIEKEMQPGMYMSEPHVLKPFAVRILKVLNETGEILHNKCKVSRISEFILGSLYNNPDPTAANMIFLLANTFPVFNDVYECNNNNNNNSNKVIFYKNATLLCHELYSRFKVSNPTVFNFTDYTYIPASPGSVIPCVLEQYGIVEIVDEKFKQSINDFNCMHENNQNHIYLRAASIVACDMIVKGYVFTQTFYRNSFYY